LPRQPSVALLQATDETRKAFPYIGELCAWHYQDLNHITLRPVGLYGSRPASRPGEAPGHVIMPLPEYQSVVGLEVRLNVYLTRPQTPADILAVEGFGRVYTSRQDILYVEASGAWPHNGSDARPPSPQTPDM
jgi:hypothetical protein